MRHLKRRGGLGRKSHQRTALLKNLTNMLLKHELIKTTLPKARLLRTIAEPLICLARTDNVTNRRLAFSRLRNQEMVCKLFEIIGPRYRNRSGGYLRILKSGFRLNDAAGMAIVQLVEESHTPDDVDHHKN